MCTFRPRVSIHAPAWGSDPAWAAKRFNPRSREGATRSRRDFIEVSIHAPAWGATSRSRQVDVARFQSTLPRGERPGRSGDRPGERCFNPRSRVGSDPTATAVDRIADVSIHAPAWGATSKPTPRSPVKFQSTLPRGERRMAMTTASTLRCFNPRSRVGSDATRSRIRRLRRRSFNPRSRVGSDDGAPPINPDVPAEFQSTLPRGERRRRQRMRRTSRFNPRSRVGSDPAQPTTVDGNVVSIHAPAWGATTNVARSSLGPCFNPRSRVGSDAALIDWSIECFNPRSRVGSDQPSGCDRSTVADSVSIHAPAWGATGCDASTAEFQSTLPRGERPPRPVRHRHAGFQSTLPRGERPQPRPPLYARKVVSIHAPAWGATAGLVVHCHWRFNPRSRGGATLARGDHFE